MLKRLNDRASFYDVKGWKKDFDKTQDYKKNICVFPSISFHHKPNTSNPQDMFSRTHTSLGNRSAYKALKINNMKSSPKFNQSGNFSDFKQTNNENKLVNLGEDRFKEEVEKKVLFTQKVFIGELYHCVVSFIIEEKRY
jgi:hypothetical protein